MAQATGISVEGVLTGCTYEGASNWNPAANDEDGSCIFSGCTNAVAVNFNPLATIDDASCIFEPDYCGSGTVWNPDTGACETDKSCISDLNNDGIIQTPDLLILSAAFGTTCP